MSVISSVNTTMKILLSATRAQPFFARLLVAFGVLCGWCFFSSAVFAQVAYVRINQVGYLTSDTKVAIAFSFCLRWT